MAAQEDMRETVINLSTPILVGLRQVARGRPGASLGGFDRAGVLRAAGILHLWPESNTVVVNGVVDPTWSGRGIGGSLMAWQEGRGRQILSQLPGSGIARMVAFAGESAANRRRLLMAAGFSTVRSVYKMRRDLKAPIQQFELPDGLQFRPLSGCKPSILLEAHNRATVDAWAPGPIYPELWNVRFKEYLPELSSVVFSATDDKIAGYALTLVETPTSAMAPRSEASIHRLAIVPKYRKHGAGRALLSHTLQQLADDGRRFATIAIDPTMKHSGRVMLEDFGFTPASRTMVYGLDL
jgi:GNAT superfamily N-acetyltransferase